jgi:ABC-type bacteriocin/lantibiotic exporter with double-glycine peptidase domain
LDEYKRTRDHKVNYSEVGIELQNAAYSWGFKLNSTQTSAPDLPVLSQLNLKLGSSDLMVVVGEIGSGKTTLLHSLMDETINLSPGRTFVRGTIAYVEQEPFIMSASIKQNVAFGLKFDD